MTFVVIVIQLLLALLLLTTGGGKLAGSTSSQAIRDSLHVTPRWWKTIGVGEMLLVVGLVAGIFLPWTALLALLGVVVLMLGAIITRIAVGGPEQRAGITVDVVVLGVALAAAALGLASR